ncbi:MAG: DUF6470 family protein [Syntrophomonas sp.]
MQLRIDQQFAQIGVRTTLANLQFSSSPAQVQIKTTPGKLEIESPRPKIHIDQSQCFANAGLKSPARLSADRASEGYSATMEAIARISSEGDQLARIKGTSLADIALSHSSETHEFDVKAIPQQPPEISFETYPVQFSYQPAEVQIDANPSQIDTCIEPGYAETYLLQKNYLNITWVGDNYDKIA